MTGGDASRFSLRAADAGISSITHGTATGSIMIGGDGTVGVPSSQLPKAELVFPKNDSGVREYGNANERVLDPGGALVGVAPLARVRSIKFIDDTAADIDRTGYNGTGVVRFADEDLVTAIDYACDSGAHVISLSVGAFMHSAVRDALDRAVEEKNLIVVAAVGQTYTGTGLNDLTSGAASIGLGGGDTVVLPAAYANVIAVAGCSPDGRPWDESHRGPNVDITAPGDAVWVADYTTDDPRAPVLEAASGTSFAAAFMAGVAALWLAHWGRERLLELYPDKPIAWVFRHQLQKTAKATDWDKHNYGPGVVDVLALLQEPLPAPKDVRAPPATTENAFTMLSGTLDSPVSWAIGDAWAVLYDLPDAVHDQIEFTWATTRGLAEGLLAIGERALEDLHSFADASGQAVDQATRDAIASVTGMIDEAAALGEAAARAAAESGEEAVEAVSDFAEKTVDTVGEAAEDVVDFLFGWAK